MIKRNSFILFIALMLSPMLYANQGGSDTFGHMWTDSRDPSLKINYEWIDIRDGAEVFIGNTDDDVSATPISLAPANDFYFSYYGKSYNKVWVSTNGFLSFILLGSSYPTNQMIPSGSTPDSILAPYWDDLIANSSGKIYKKTVGSAPNRKFIVQWDNFRSKNWASGYITFEVVLYETSNLIKFQYLSSSITTNDTLGASATVGIKGGTDGSLYSYNQVVSSPGNLLKAILFHNASVNSAIASIAPNQINAGETQQFDYKVDNISSPVPSGAPGLGKLDRLSISNPFLGQLPTVTSIKLNDYDAYLRYVSNPNDPTEWPTQPGYAVWGIVSDSIVIQSYYFDVVDSAKVSFVQTAPSTSSSGNAYPSTFDAFYDQSARRVATESGLLTWQVDVVAAQNPSGIKIFTDAAGTTEFGDVALTAGNSQILYAGLVDQNGNFMNLVAADWSVKPGTLGTFQNGDSTVVGSMTATFTAEKVGNGAIYVSYDDGGKTYSDASGLITVQHGAADHVVLRSEANNGGNVMSGQSISLTTDNSVTLYAAHYDAYDNYVGDNPVEWTSTGLPDENFGATPTAFITYEPSLPSTGGAILTNSSTLVNDQTGSITVTVGALNQIVIRDNTPPAGNEITTLTLISGQMQNLVASGYDRDGNFIANQSVNWDLEGDAIGVLGAANPSATNTLTTGTIGSAVIHAITSSGPSFEDRTSSIQVVAGNPAALEKVIESDNQVGPTGQELPISIKVIIKDNQGNPVSGVTVNWSPSNDGLVNAPTSLTDSDGIASIRWTLRSTPGMDSLTADVPGFSTAPETVVFHATAESPAHRTMSYVNEAQDTLRNGTVQTVVEPFRVIVKDSLDQPLAGASVNFAVVNRPNGSANDSLFDTQVLTGADGIAQTSLRLGTKLGDYDIVAYTNAIPSQLTFTGKADSPGAADAIQILSGNNQTGVVSQQLAQPVQVKLVDAYDNPLANETLIFDLLDGGSVNPATSPTDENGNALTNWTLSGTTGTQRMTVAHPPSGVVSGTIHATAQNSGAAAIELLSIRGVAHDSVSSLPNGNTPFKIKVIDQQGNVVPNQAVTFSIQLGANAVLSQTTALTDANGGIVNAVAIDPQANLTILRAAIGGLTRDIHIYRIQYVANSLQPESAFASDQVGFTMQINNPGPHGVKLSTSNSLIKFSDGTHSYQALVSSPDSILPESPALTLTFNNTQLNAGFIDAAYQPEIVLKGADADVSFGGSIFTENDAFHVFSVSIQTISIVDPVQRHVTAGETAEFILDVENGGSSDIILNSNTRLTFGTDVFVVSANQTIFGNTTSSVKFAPKTVTSSSQLAGYPATLQINGTIKGANYQSNVSVNDNVFVDSSPNVSIQNFAVVPSSATQGESGLAVTMQLGNGTDSNTYAQAIIQSLTIKGNSGDPITTAVSPVLPSTLSKGPAQTYTLSIDIPDIYPVGATILWPEITLADANTGTVQTVNGISSGDTDNLNVLSHADIVIDSIRAQANPVSQGQENVPVYLYLHNTGQSTAILNSALISFLNNHAITRTTTLPKTITGGDTAIIHYSVGINPNAAVGTDSISASVQFADAANGKDYPTVTRRDAGTLEIFSFGTNLVSIDAVNIVPDRVSRGQSGIAVQIKVRNGGQSSVRINGMQLLYPASTFSQGTPTPLLPQTIPGNNGTVTFTVLMTAFSNADTGLVSVDATINYMDLTSGQTGNLAGALNTDQVRIQTPAAISIQNLAITNTPVSTGTFQIPAVFDVVNSGQAAARITSVTSIVNPSNPNITFTRVSPLNFPQTIQGGSTERFVYRMDVATSSDIGDFRVQFSSLGQDANDGRVIASGLSNTDTLRVQRAGVLIISDVVVDADTVVTGQANLPATVTVENTGEADVAVSRLTLTFDGEIEGFAQAVAPTDSVNFLLRPGNSQTIHFLFTVLDNAVPQGETRKGYLVGAEVSGIEKNNNTVVSDNKFFDTIEVIKGGTIQINNLSVTGPPRVPFVNYDQNFTINVNVTNNSEEVFQNVEIKLLEDNTAVDTLISDLVPGNTIVRFNRIAPMFAENVIYQVNFIPGTGTSRYTATPPIIGSSENNTYLLHVQKPAELKLTILPKSMSLSKNQNSEVKAVVTNTGNAPVGDNGVLRLTIPASVQFQDGVSETQPVFQQNSAVDTVVWGIIGLEKTEENIPDTVTVSWENVPTDLNINADAALVNVSDSALISVDTLATVNVDSLVIVSPDGARDKTVSTSQQFVLRAYIRTTGSLTEKNAQLSLPPKFSVQGATTRQLIDGVLFETVDWIVIAPDSVPPSTSIIQVTASALCVTCDLVKQSNKSISVEVQKRALLSLEASGPENSLVSTGQAFPIRYNIRNDGEAPIVGKSKVAISLATGLSFTAPPMTEVVKDTVSFKTDTSLTVYALELPLANRIIMGQFVDSEVANDTNTTAPAAVKNTSAALNIQIVTKASLKISGKIVEPSGALDDTVSFGQTFKYEVLVTNMGSAETEQTGHLKVTGDTLLLFDQSSKNFQIGIPDTFTVQVDTTTSATQLLRELRKIHSVKPGSGGLSNDLPGIQSMSVSVSQPVDVEKLNAIYAALKAEVESAHLVVTIDGIPKDLNTGEPVKVENNGFSKTIVVEAAADLQPSLQTPSTVSTEQIFTVTASVLASPQISDQKKAILTIPDGFKILDDSQKNFTGEQVSWQVQAPTTLTADQQSFPNFQVVTSGNDLNSGEMVQKQSASVSVLVQKKALLSIRASVDNKPYKQLAFNQIFELRVLVSNKGKASLNLLENPGILKLSIPDTVFANSNKNLELTKQVQWTGETGSVNWTLRAPQKSSTTTLNVSFTEIPADVNTQAPAGLLADSSVASVAVSTQPHSLVVQKLANITPGSSINQQGTPNIALLGLDLTNGSLGNQAIPGITIDSVAISLRNRNGQYLAAPGRIVSKVKLVNLAAMSGSGGITYADVPFGESADSTTKIQLSNPLSLGSGEEGSLVVLVDLADNSPNVSFSLRIDKLYVYDNAGNEVQVVDDFGQAFNVFNDQGLSAPINVVSSNESEIFGNYPNPFGQNESFTRFVFLMKGAGTVEIDIYTLLGGLVWNKKVDVPSEGLYNDLLTWNGYNNSGQRVLNGVYIAIIKINDTAGNRSYKTKVAYIK